MRYRDMIDELILAGDTMEFPDWMKEIVHRLHEETEHYSWVGIYWLEGEHLRLDAWKGPEETEHERIPVGEGICGLAARTKETVVVDDVDRRDEYLACFPWTQSEIVVPIVREDEVVGEIDIGADRQGAFSSEDKRELERLADAIARHFPVDA